MTIRLTTVDAFEKVLEKLKQDPMYGKEINKLFFKYCVPDIKAGLQDGTDEWYLDVDWVPDTSAYRVVMTIRYHKRSEIMTDTEYLTTKESEL